jgi:succinate dehydrogenase / fumarate reductase, cytochrome b subunit|tara:strand:+ start:590 stop:976 length:387 start_codon:yes stop_codon:yes gene_type:complete
VVGTVKSQRPVNLDITTIKFTPQMIASITHRIAGVAIFVGMAFLIWGLGLSLQSQESFDALKECMDSVVAKLIVWAILAGFIYHFIAGVRHLLMDAGYFETLEGSRILSIAVMIVSAVLIVAAGVWVW